MTQSSPRIDKRMRGNPCESRAGNSDPAQEGPRSIARLFFTPKEFMWMTHLSHGKVASMIATGELRSVLVGRSRRIPADAVSEWIARLAAEAE